MELFNVFCSSTVHITSGPFNQSFWRIDVPRAAVKYPAMWHASIALAAIHMSVTNEATKMKGAKINPATMPNPYLARNYQYQLALEHFNKSIRYLSQTLTSRNDNFSYADKEMAIMTNMLYIGIGSIVDDEEQMHSHQKNMLRLLKTFRFGEDDPASCQGVMAYEGLLSLVLALDGSFTNTEDILFRWQRDWVVKTPMYDSLTSITQAYIAIMPLIFTALFDEDMAAIRAYTGPAKYVRRRAYVRRLQRNLRDLQMWAADAWTKDEEESIEIITQHLEVLKIKEATWATTSPDDIIRMERGYFPVLDRLEIMLSEPDVNYRPYVPGQPFVFSFSFGTLLELILSLAHNVEVRHRANDMIRRFPYRESGARSHESYPFYDVCFEHEETGMARTLALQTKLAAKAAADPGDPNVNSLLDRVNQCIDDCTCVPGLFFCWLHRMAQCSSGIAASDVRYHEFQNRFELINHIPATRYYVSTSH